MALSLIHWRGCLVWFQGLKYYNGKYKVSEEYTCLVSHVLVDDQHCTSYIDNV